MIVLLSRFVIRALGPIAVLVHAQLGPCLEHRDGRVAGTYRIEALPCL